MVTLEQFLVVALVVLLTVIVACGVVAVVLLAQTLRAENSGKTTEEQKSTPTRTLRHPDKAPRLEAEEDAGDTEAHIAELTLQYMLVSKLARDLIEPSKDLETDIDKYRGP